MTGQIEPGLMDPPPASEPQALCAGACVLRGFALEVMPRLLTAIDGVIERAPLRHMITPGGFRMSVAMTNCGDFGWISDRRGYRYGDTDPETARPWPPLPASFLALASAAAAAGGFSHFVPDACLINRYEPGARMSLHQDRNERDFSQPIVSVSLGVPATFLFGGLTRAMKPLRLRLVHGDVVVWGGPARLNFHGVSPLRPDSHESLGLHRINLTLRKI